MSAEEGDGDRERVGIWKRGEGGEEAMIITGTNWVTNGKELRERGYGAFYNDRPYLYLSLHTTFTLLFA